MNGLVWSYHLIGSAQNQFSIKVKGSEQHYSVAVKKVTVGRATTTKMTAENNKLICRVC